MNAILQVLVHIVDIPAWYNDKRHKRGNPIGQFCAVFADVMESLRQDRQGPVNPQRFVYKFTDLHPNFVLGQQQDAAEFLVRLSETMYEQLGDITPLHNLFGIELLHSNLCGNGHQSNNGVDLKSIELHMNRQTDVAGLLADFLETEFIDDEENLWYCEQCDNHVSYTKTTSVLVAPQYLTVTFKRFRHFRKLCEKTGVVTHHIEKILTPIRINKMLHIDQHMETGTNIVYKLHSVVLHQGKTPTSGHYFTLIPTDNETWIRYDDSNVTNMNTSDVNWSLPYICVYQRIEMEPSPSVKASKIDNIPVPQNPQIDITDTPLKSTQSNRNEQRSSSPPVSINTKPKQFSALLLINSFVHFNYHFPTFHMILSYFFLSISISTFHLTITIIPYFLHSNRLMSPQSRTKLLMMESGWNRMESEGIENKTMWHNNFNKSQSPIRVH